MPELSKKTWFILIILALSIITRFAFFGFPSSTVFDEVHFGKFVDAYYTGEYYFDIHPPLGKLLIAGAAELGGYEAGDFKFNDIGEGFQDSIYKYMRFLPSLAGALLPVILFLIALRLGFSNNVAAFVGLALVFENALVVQSRFILMDSFLLLFGFLAIYFYLKKNFLLVGIFAALAGSIKWTGLSFLGIIAVLYFFAWLNEGHKMKNARKGIVYLIIVPLIVYFSIFALHFSLLPNPGQGSAFMSQEFRDGKTNVFDNFLELNEVMYTSNKNLSADHPFSSHWYQWPMSQKPIFYWQGDNNMKIYLLGNPLIWLLGFASIILMILARNKTATQKFLIFAFLINWLPFIFIGRVMFMYHYFPALIFSILALGYMMDRKIRKSHYVILTLAVIAVYMILSPLTYGISPPGILNPIIEFFI